MQLNIYLEIKRNKKMFLLQGSMLIQQIKIQIAPLKYMDKYNRNECNEIQQQQ